MNRSGLGGEQLLPKTSTAIVWKRDLKFPWIKFRRHAGGDEEKDRAPVWGAVVSHRAKDETIIVLEDVKGESRLVDLWHKVHLIMRRR